MPIKEFLARNEPYTHLDVLFEFPWIRDSKRGDCCIRECVHGIQGHGESGGSRREARVQGWKDQNVNIAVGEFSGDFAGRGDVFVEGGVEEDIL